MGVLQNLSKALGLSRDMDVEEYMDAVEMEDVDLLNEPADFYVKPIALESEVEAKLVEDELKAKNIVLLNITPMLRNQAKVKQLINNLKNFVRTINGDIALIDAEKILLTPGKVKIVKRRKK